MGKKFIQYDTYGQLVRENNKILDKSIQYVYNNIGNIESVKTYAYTPKGTELIGTPIKTETFTYDADKLTAYNGSSLTHNANGGVSSYDGWDYTWTRGKLSTIRKILSGTSRALISPVLMPSKTYSYTYNGYGQRIGKSYSYIVGAPGMTDVYRGMPIGYDKKFHYDQSGRLIAEDSVNRYYNEMDETDYIVYLYDESGIIGMEYTATSGATNTYYFQRNIQGDVVAIYNTNGKKVGGYDYDAWGNCSITLDTNGIASRNPIRYRGYYFDSETGFYYLNSRYYSPEWRRFISPDDTAYLDPENVNGLNLYCYCNNDPINYADPSGHSWESFWNGVGDWLNEHWVELAIGTAFIIGGAIVTAVTCGAGTTAWAAFGSALLSSAIQVGASVAVGIGINGIVNLANGNNFFDNVGETIASSYMLSGIAAGASQVVSGAFRTLFLKLGYTGTNTNYLGFLSPDKLYYDHAGMTILRVGARKGIKLALDLGRYGIHAHILGDLHAPIIPLLVGALEAYIADRRY